MTTETLLNKMFNNPFVVVPLVTERSRSRDPQLSITISVKLASFQENAEASMQDAQTAVTAASIESQRDLGLELENGVKDLQEVLESVVGTIIDKIDVLAQVRFSVEGSLRVSYDRFVTSIISSILTQILPGKHVRFCIG